MGLVGGEAERQWRGRWWQGGLRNEDLGIKRSAGRIKKKLDPFDKHTQDQLWISEQSLQPLLSYVLWDEVIMLNWRKKWQPTPVTLAWRIPWREEPGRLQSKEYKSKITKSRTCLSNIACPDKKTRKTTCWLAVNPRKAQIYTRLPSLKSNTVREML